MDLTTLVLGVAGLSALYLAWNIGANDLSNAMATSVASRALTLRQAVVLAAAGELLGALLAGGTVSGTMSGTVVDAGMLDVAPATLALGLGCALAAATVWIQLATWFGWPVSTTHAIVSAMVGVATSIAGTAAVLRPEVGWIAGAWIASPVAAAALAYTLFVTIRRYILVAERPVLAAFRFGPLLAAPAFFAVAFAVTRGGLGGAFAAPPLATSLVVAAAVALAGTLAIRALLGARTRGGLDLRHADGMQRAESAFLAVQPVTAAFLAFAHGSNDVGNAVGPLSAVFAGVSGREPGTAGVPFEVLLIGAVAMVIGVSTYGFRVIAMVGREISELSASRGVVAEVATASMVLFSSELGLPVSTTHTLVGAVVGVGVARSLGALDTRVVRQIVVGALVTVPACAVPAAGLFLLAQAVLAR